MGYRLLATNLSEVDEDLELGQLFYAYPHEHYATWQTMRAQAKASAWGEPLPYGSLGENLTTEGLLESELWIGDVLQFPHCQLAVSGPGLVSDEINKRLGFPQASRMMIQSGWCGFYLAVRDGGPFTAGETFSVIPGPREIGIRELFADASGKYMRRR